MEQAKMWWTTLMSNPLTKYLVIVVLAVLSSGLFTYSVVSTRYELKITKLEKDISDAQVALAAEKAKKQENILEDVAAASNNLSIAIKSAKAQADELKKSLGGAILVTKECNPTEEFKTIWNASGKQ